MTGNSLSLILLPTLSCNADCRYCFEHRSGATLDMRGLSIILEKVLDYMDEQKAQTLFIYWQGGELMTLPVSWFEEARILVDQVAADKNKEIRNFAQSNMIGYTQDWGRILSSMFGNSVGTSMDYPNIDRVMVGGTAAEFSDIWYRRVSEAREAGIDVGVISIPNQDTIMVGAELFYSHFVDDLQIKDFQINLPFPAGPGSDSVRRYPLEKSALSRFLSDLLDVWIERGHERGVAIGPFDSLLESKLEGITSAAPCIWRDNCSNEFLCIDPSGNVAQCDCWVASYPEHWFGNIFKPGRLADLLRNSAARHVFRERPSVIIQQEDCLDCEYLSMCHGGCPIKAYSVCGSINRKDPYCEVYKSIFRSVSEVAATLAFRRSRRTPEQAI